MEIVWRLQLYLNLKLPGLELWIHTNDDKIQPLDPTFSLFLLTKLLILVSKSLCSDGAFTSCGHLKFKWKHLMVPPAGEERASV